MSVNLICTHRTLTWVSAWASEEDGDVSAMTEQKPRDERRCFRTKRWPVSIVCGTRRHLFSPGLKDHPATDLVPADNHLASAVAHC